MISSMKLVTNYPFINDACPQMNNQFMLITIFVLPASQFCHKPLPEQTLSQSVATKFPLNLHYLPLTSPSSSSSTHPQNGLLNIPSPTPPPPLHIPNTTHRPHTFPPPKNLGRTLPPPIPASHTTNTPNFTHVRECTVTSRWSETDTSADYTLTIHDRYG